MPSLDVSIPHPSYLTVRVSTPLPFVSPVLPVRPCAPPCAHAPLRGPSQACDFVFNRSASLAPILALVAMRPDQPISAAILHKAGSRPVVSASLQTCRALNTLALRLPSCPAFSFLSPSAASNGVRIAGKALSLLQLAGLIAVARHPRTRTFKLVDSPRLARVCATVSHHLCPCMHAPVCLCGHVFVLHVCLYGVCSGPLCVLWASLCALGLSVCCMPLCVLHASLCAACLSVCCMPLCVLHASLCAACLSVCCMPLCVLHASLCAACLSVCCMPLCVLHASLCAACLSVCCMPLCVLHASLCAACLSVCCMPLCVLHASLCTACLVPIIRVGAVLSSALSEAASTCFSAAVPMSLLSCHLPRTCQNH
ncbi:unnamed protein product [Closterium sp. Naga37s-1]|nr:unnamed protein product [Closterium sp. Naga37s-1]